MNSFDDPVWLDAADQAEAVRSGAMMLEGPTRNGLGQVEAYDAELNCLVSDRRGYVADELSSIPADAPFRGVPVLIKDLSCGIAGESMWNGNRVLQGVDYHAAHDSTIVRRLRAAGLVVLGRTNTAEFGATITTEPGATGITRNPWNPRLTSGGSSGGSAAGVAAGYAPVAHGTDASGSVRIPASACGILGFKPTNGAIPLDPEERGGWFGLSTPGVLARSSRDMRAIAAILEGEPVCVDPQWPDQTEEPLTVAVLDVCGLRLDPAVAAALAGTVQLLTELGHNVETAMPPFMFETDFHRTFLTLVGAGLAGDISYWEATLGVEIRSEDLDPSTAALLTYSQSTSAAHLAAALAWRDRYQTSADEWWVGRFDVLVTPVLRRAHAEIGWYSDPDQGGRRVRDDLQFTAQFNMAGNPAVSVPLHQTSEGLPVGTQLVAGRGKDQLLLGLVRDLERLASWAPRHPNLHPVDFHQPHLAHQS